MHFINKQNDIAVGSFNVFQNGFQPFFKFAAEFGTGNQRPHIQRQQAFVFQTFGNVIIDNAHGQAFNNCRFAHTGLTDQYRVVFGAAGQDLNGTADFVFTADHGVKLAFSGFGGNIYCIFFQGFKIFFGAFGIGNPAFAIIVNCLIQAGRGYTGIAQNIIGFGAVGHCQRLQNALSGHELVSGLVRQLFGFLHYTGKVLRHQTLHCGARYLGNPFNGIVCGSANVSNIAAGIFQQAGYQPVFIIQQNLQKMFRCNILVFFARRQINHVLNQFFGLVGQFFKIHSQIPLLSLLFYLIYR